MLNNPFPKSNINNVPVFNYPITEVIKLLPSRHFKKVNLWDIINDRKSEHSFSQLSLEMIGNILWSSAKVRNIFLQEDGYILTQRPSPSAGGRHPIDIIILSPVLNGMESFFYYNPFEHSLNKLELENTYLKEFKEHVSSIFDIGQGTVIWFIAHPNRTTAKYINPLSLIWRDAGALIQCIQLTCTGYGIHSCAMGTLGEPFISKIFSTYGTVFGVGGVIVG